MSLESVTDTVRERVATATGFDHTVKFDFGDDGKVFINGNDNTVSNDDGDADCTITMTLENFEKMTAGDLDPTTAFMMGKLKVSGDMGVAMKLSSVI
jgi:putative sterol carrier protein